MAGQVLGELILWLVAVAVAVAIAVYLLRALYRRSTKDTAFVRTGFLGEKVIVNGGAFVVPVLHDITLVGMNVLRIEVRRGERQALITKDRMRVDVDAEFFVKVEASIEAVALAAQTLGRHTADPDGLRELLEGRFSSAMRTVAAQMTLEELHERRKDYAQTVRELAAGDLVGNGLGLDSVAIVDLDQTSLDFFDPSNAFDAEGLTQLTEAIETRRKMRNEIEQRTQVAIRTQNLDAQRQVLAIDRDAEYARLEQEREVEVRRAEQRALLARERAVREQEAEEAQIGARERIERARMGQERSLAEVRIAHEEETQRLEIARRRALEQAELQSRERTEQEQIALDLGLEKARIERERTQQALEVSRRGAIEVAELERQMALAVKAVEVTRAEAERRRTEIVSNQEIEVTRIVQDQALDRVRLERERALEALQIAKRQAFEEAEIVAGEEVERARIATERGLEEARLVRERDMRRLAVARDQAVEEAEIEKAIELARRTAQRSAAQAEAEVARAAAVEAEEQAFTVRERAIAERRKLTDLIAAERDAERDSLRLTIRAKAEEIAAASFAEAQRIGARATAEAEKVAAEAAARRYEVDARGQSQVNEAENILSDGARASRLRAKLLDRIEGIVRESVRPLERIEGIKILHVDGGGGGQGTQRNVTDEVIDSALRYRVQAPLIDSLMKEIGIEGGSLGRMTEVLRDAKDIASLTAERGKGEAPPPDDRDRD